MPKYLLIVESPAKAKTINKYLGKDYIVKASVGHIMDLPVSRLGVDIAHDFAPEYEIIKGKKKVVDEITAAAKTAEKVFLAPDPDREGEAIASHIAELIRKGFSRKGAGTAPEIYRVLFNEITKKGIESGMKHPGVLNTGLVEAQQARRILDRLVGYQISPLLWDKVKRNLSAGRVQSVAVRLICDRESEIQAFKPEEYWSMDVMLLGSLPPAFKARLAQWKNKKLELPNQAETERHLAALKQSSFILSSIDKKERQRRPYAPFITSTLQQDAARRLGFTAKKTMMLAQRLYEGISLESGETVGLITYMRTDSTRLAQDAIDEARAFIGEQFSAGHLPATAPQYAKKAAAQDAHEAIRPTSVYRTPASLKQSLERDLFRLYELIWKRLLASQMSPALYDQTTFHISAGEYGLRATGSILRFKGFLSIYEDAAVEKESTSDDDSSEDRSLPDLKQGETLKPLEFLPEQHFTQPPPRYTEASLVKELEERGIGRPSTYATIISTIQDKKYAEKVENRFHPTELGKVVTTLLVEHFQKILDPQFTAKLESELDDIEAGKRSSNTTLHDFYHTFKPDLEKAKLDMKNLKKQEIATDLSCPKCSAPMVIKWGKNGEFIACSAYPECKTTGEFARTEDGKIAIKEDEKVDDLCPKCGASMVVKRGRFGQFLACSAYPECKTTKAISIGVPCPDCGGPLAARTSKRGKVFFGCTTYPNCKFASWDKPVATPCPDCGSPYLVEKVNKTGTVVKCPKPGCSYKVID